MPRSLLAPVSSLICLVVPALALLSGCSDDGGTAASTMGASDTEGSTAATAASASTASTGASGTASTGAMSTGSETEATTSAMCPPSDDPDLCNYCTSVNCCAQLDACDGDPVCTCMTGCATSLDTISMCTDKCGATNTFSALTQCVILHCASPCT